MINCLKEHFDNKNKYFIKKNFIILQQLFLHFTHWIKIEKLKAKFQFLNEWSRGRQPYHQSTINACLVGNYLFCLSTMGNIQILRCVDLCRSCWLGWILFYFFHLNPHTATLPLGLSNFIAASKCMPPTFSKYMSIPSEEKSLTKDANSNVLDTLHGQI